MKKILSTFLFFPALAIAQSQIINFESYCLSLDNLAKVLEKHGEEPMMTFSSHRTENGVTKKYNTVMFMNSETRTYTIAERVKDNFFCVTSVGSDTKPYIVPPDINKRM